MLKVENGYRSIYKEINTDQLNLIGWVKTNQQITDMLTKIEKVASVKGLVEEKKKEKGGVGKIGLVCRVKNRDYFSCFLEREEKIKQKNTKYFY